MRAISDCPLSVPDPSSLVEPNVYSRVAETDLARFNGYATTKEELPNKSVKRALEHFGYTIQRKLGAAADFGMTLRGDDNIFQPVVAVVPGGPAHKAGIRVGDRIGGYKWQKGRVAARREAATGTHLDILKQSFAPGQPVTLTVFQDNNEREIVVTPGSLPNGVWESRIVRKR